MSEALGPANVSMALFIQVKTEGRSVGAISKGAILDKLADIEACIADISEEILPSTVDTLEEA
jgi:hypothetical protein